MKTPKRVLMKRKIAFRAMPTARLEEMLEFKKAELEKIKNKKEFYHKCYTDEENRLYYSQPVEQMISLLEDELTSRQQKKDTEQEQAL